METCTVWYFLLAAHFVFHLNYNITSSKRLIDDFHRVVVERFNRLEYQLDNLITHAWIWYYSIPNFPNIIICKCIQWVNICGLNYEHGICDSLGSWIKKAWSYSKSNKRKCWKKFWRVGRNSLEISSIKCRNFINMKQVISSVKVIFFLYQNCYLQSMFLMSYTCYYQIFADCCALLYTSVK